MCPCCRQSEWKPHVCDNAGTYPLECSVDIVQEEDYDKAVKEKGKGKRKKEKGKKKVNGPGSTLIGTPLYEVERGRG
jgi:hypothetical protein